jgi:transcriptional regulator
MYNLPDYKEADQQVLLEFMKAHSFAMLIGIYKNLPVATQIPFLVEEKDGKIFLQGHMMKNTDHHKAFEENKSALIVFTGAHTYVSGSWYSNPQTASTWNYMSIHARGDLKFEDEEKLLHILDRTTTHFENNKDSPASFHHLPKDYIDRLVKAIVGFEIEILEMENVFKLSQNRDKESYHSIIKELENSDGNAKEIAAEMKKRTLNLFK